MYLKDEDTIPNLSDEYRELICDIAFKDSSIMHEDFPLPIGASTSPIISNILLYRFDECMSEHSNSLGITYTRYADDLIFFHNEPHRLNGVKDKVKEV